MMGGGPPVNPPTMPTLSAIPSGEMDSPGPGMSAALPQLVFNVEQQIKTIARLLPDQSEALDQIVEELRNILSMSLQGSSSVQRQDPNQMGESPF